MGSRAVMEILRIALTRTAISAAFARWPKMSDWAEDLTDDLGEEMACQVEREQVSDGEVDEVERIWEAIK